MNLQTLPKVFRVIISEASPAAGSLPARLGAIKGSASLGRRPFLVELISGSQP